MGQNCTAPEEPRPPTTTKAEAVKTKQFAELDAAVHNLSSHKGEWAALPLKSKLALLNEMHTLMMNADHEAWAADSLRAMGYPIDALKAGKLPPPAVAPTEMMLAIEMLMNTRIMSRDIEQLIDTLADLENTGKAPEAPLRTLPSGQQIADTYPRTQADKNGPQKDWKVELWLEPGAKASQGKFYSRDNHEGGVPLGKVAVVLGAGNQGFLTMCDVLYMMFIEGAVVILKHNPVRDYNHKWVEYLFAPLIREGYCHSFNGTIEEGSHVLNHPLVQHVHITGGTATHDAIVWGVGEAQAANKAKLQPVLQKPMTSELGCITPWMVAPAEFTEEEIMHHCKHLATAFMQNNSCNCNAPKLLVLPEGWPQKEQFLATLKGILEMRPSNCPYYPGTLRRYEAFEKEYPEAQRIVSKIPSKAHPKYGEPVPPLFITLPPASTVPPLGSEDHPYALHNEPFAPVLMIIEVGGDFLTEAPKFVNNHVLGTLSATLIAHPSLEKEKVDAALEALNYGTIALNTWTGSTFQFETGSWGAFPGERLEAVQSGIGAVRNYLLFDHVQKSVVRSPFLCESHIGVAKEMMTLPKARFLCDIMVGKVDTATEGNKNNPYRMGNMLPIATEGSFKDLRVVSGAIPNDLNGMFVRNGTVQKCEPSGKMHMYDGDAMIHCLRIKGGKVETYANTWLRTPRHIANEQHGNEKDLYATFGDLAQGGLPVARKMGLQGAKMKSGAIPTLKDNERTHPATSVYYVDGQMYAVMELSPPFRMKIDPVTGVVTSGGFDDKGGQLDRMSAHYKTDNKTGETHYMVTGFFSPMCTYGTLTAQGEIGHTLKMRFEQPPPAFLHDYFLTENYTIIVDHSMRINPGGLVASKLYEFKEDKPLRFGLIPRGASTPEAVKWFDTGRTGTHWHCVNGWETEDNKVVLYMPIFDEYPSSMPVHIASEPHSKLHKFVLDLETEKCVEGLPGVDAQGKVISMNEVATERCEFNRDYTGKASKWAYLMRRGKDEMYDGFVKFNLETDEIDTVVDFGEKRLGGECLFVPKEGATEEDDGYLMDIIFDGTDTGPNTDGIGISQLCIWDAANLTSKPVAKVQMPHRVPFGVHAGWLNQQELEAQANWF